MECQVNLMLWGRPLLNEFTKVSLAAKAVQQISAYVRKMFLDGELPDHSVWNQWLYRE